MRLPVPVKASNSLKQRWNHHVTDLPSLCRDSKNKHHHNIFRRPIYHPQKARYQKLLDAPVGAGSLNGYPCHGLTRDLELRPETLTCAALLVMMSALGVVDLSRLEKKKKG